MLIDHVYVKVKDKYGISPLLAAIFENHKECVKLLLAKVCS
jgi:ankyrin repeat protein